MATDEGNSLLIQVLKGALAREERKKEQAEMEMIKINLEFLELGVEIPLGE